MAKIKLEKLLQRRSVPVRGDVLRRIRLQRGLSIADLCKIAGVSEERLSKVEQGGKKIYADNFSSIASALRIKTWESLVDWNAVVEAEPKPPTPIGKQSVTILAEKPQDSGESNEIHGIRAAIDLANKLAEQEGNIVGLYVDSESHDLIATIEYSNPAISKFATSLCNGGLADGIIRAAKITIDISLKELTAHRNRTIADPQLLDDKPPRLRASRRASESTHVRKDDKYAGGYSYGVHDENSLNNYYVIRYNKFGGIIFGEIVDLFINNNIVSRFACGGVRMEARILQDEAGFIFVLL